ncbi:MAG: DUF3800 domain-containing protein [Anaerolineae bacterium]|nr:DUF3800 domain-containing protein [Anaerolineae bacterium]
MYATRVNLHLSLVSRILKISLFMPRQKIYCYVDESGQDTSAQTSRTQIFVVAVTVVDKERDELERLCEQYEAISKKGKFKWGKANRIARHRYLKLVFADDRFKKALRYVVFGDVKKQFDVTTIKAIARAVLWDKPKFPYAVLVYVDGLSRDKRHSYSAGLRDLGVSLYQIRGVARDESSPLTRLADALAGFVRDAETGESEAQILLELAKRDGEVVEV